MGYKRIIRKIAKFILASQPESFVQVNVEQVQSGNMLRGKKIVITGGGSGLGYAMARKFISEGASVVISGRNEAKLKKAVEELGAHCQYIVGDVCDVEHSADFLEQAKQVFGGTIDCLVSNAGVSMHEGNYQNVTVEGFDRQFNTKFRAGYFLGKAFLEMKTKESCDDAELLYISSETGDQAYDIPYGMTNAALNSAVGAFSRRVYKSGIRVNAIGARCDSHRHDERVRRGKRWKHVPRLCFWPYLPSGGGSGGRLFSVVRCIQMYFRRSYSLQCRKSSENFLG